MRMAFRVLLAGCSLLMALVGGAEAQQYEGRELVKAALVADGTHLVPGSTIRVGLHLRQAPGWHTYWQYPGDSGMPTRMKWEFPPGFEAGPLQWPAPKRIVEPGDLEVYAYKDEVLLVTEIRVPAGLTGGPITLRAGVQWLVCESICIPGRANLELSLPVADRAAPANAELFARFTAQLPRPGPPPFTTAWKREGDALVLRVSGVPSDAEFDFLPLPGDAVLPARPTVRSEGPDRVVRVPVGADFPGDRIDGLLKVTSPETGVAAWALGAVPAPAVAGRDATRTPSAAPAGRGGLWRNLLYGFLGGLLMNVMPCVLPVLALKIYGFLEQAGHSRARVFELGLAFTGGVFAWFLGLAALVVGFQAAGSSLNWSFQFQHPPFVAAMLVICLLFGLNLLGVFEVLLPAGANNWLGRVTGHGGMGGAFVHGLFATLLGSACTAPLLAPAIGFALSQPPPVVFAIFGAAAAGMALPYFLLSANPAWMRFLPRPGNWMVRMQQAMGLLVLATAVWFGSILWSQLTAKPDDFPARLERALASGRPVFVDFTADWCINCKVNERTVLRSREVQEAFARHNVEFLVADWTSGDPKITALLRAHGRAGVPFYLLYPAGQLEGARPLPELLTRQIVLDSLATLPTHP
jgi:DsbC/DsbD-like thiol-disulfide interchange protein/cytochrome c biogenesis protein CcdA